MPKATAILAATGIALLACTGGCELADIRPGLSPSAPESALEIPLYLEGTVGQYAVLYGGGYMNLQGYGLVIALGTNGSSQLPGHLIEHYRRMLRRQNVGRYSYNTQSLTPDRILRDKDTAPVLLGATIPPGAPAGSRFDVSLSSFGVAQTRSLDGGYLMPANMHLAWAGMARPSGPSFVWAEARGPVFVDPFVDFSDPSALGQTRDGRVVGGLKLLKDRPIRLHLRQGDYDRCRRIETRLNEQFGGRAKVANATDAFTISLSVPARWRDDYEHFLALVMHTPLVLSGPRWEKHLLELAAAMKSDDAEHEQIALLFEAVGRQLLPLLKPLYVSQNDNTAFYSARTGLRLGDFTAADVLIRFADEDGSFLQLAAIEELGRHRKVIRSVPILRGLLNSDSALVRVAAYEALLAHGRTSHVKRYEIGDQFVLDLVESERKYVIYATQTGRPRIALFGKDMIISRPMFFSTSDDLVTVKASMDDEKLMVYRSVGLSGRYSDPFMLDFTVASLVRVLGTRPEPDMAGDVKGLGLTYGQVVRVLHEMCKEDIPAKFVLQPTPEIIRMYREDFEGGRGDMPE